jgi:hypothetical protein
MAQSPRRSPLAVARALTIACLLLSGAGALAVEDAQSQFDTAMRAIEADELRTARKNLVELLAGNPSLHRARLELARVYYMTRNYPKARQEAQRVLDDPNTPPAVRTTVLAFLAQINEDERRYAQRHQWTPSIYFGGMYDSNVNVGPDRDVVDINGTSFLVSPDSKEESDAAAVVNAAITHTYNPGSTFDSGEHTGFFLWQSDAGAYYRNYFDEDDYNLGVLTLRTGPAWIVPRHWRAWTMLQADQIWLGEESLALYTGLNPGVTWDLSGSTEVTLEGNVTQRQYWDDEEEGRDGWYEAATLSATHYLGNRNFAIQGGVGYAHFDADDERFGHQGPLAFGGLIWEAWRDGVVFARVAYQQYDYDGPEPGYNEARDDDEWRYTLGFDHDFRSGLLADWSLQGSWIYTDNPSNLDIYDYDRHVVNLGLARTF